MRSGRRGDPRDPPRARLATAARGQPLASPGLLGEFQDQGIRAIVWTVNGDEMTARWLPAPDVDVVVTDHPARAIALRDRLRGEG